MLAKCGVKMKTAWKNYPLQNKAIRIINFKQQDFPVNELYNANGILKMEDYIYICLTFSLSKMYYQMNL